ncbi:MAG: hypothetical protein GF331_17880 [Chitinivibrionales bacterium]|nr:hypothetical protein [Chitinivibrionales bacterium]
MSLSRHLQQSIFSQPPTGDPRELKERIFAAGREWYEQHPDEFEVLRGNLQLFDLPADDQMVDSVRRHVLLHYYEKLIPLFCSPAVYAKYLSEHVIATEAIDALKRHQADGKAALLAISHFGAVELITPVLALHGLTVTAALRFTTAELSRSAWERAEQFHASGHFGKISFIEVGKPGVAAALEMAAVVRRAGILVSVFDERTEYSVPVTLFGQRLWGGAGLDRLLAFSRSPSVLVGAFMVREGDEQYRLELSEVPADEENPVQGLYDRLQTILERHPEQWYFLHEEIPLADK